ncbi:MAG: TOBE domain-containing protein [Sulfuricurvum sp.]|nr:TOBE domain-containing protein [Sulfuricurvum sp.]
MNAFFAKVESIKSDEFFSCITVQAKDKQLKLVKTKAPQWLSIGDEVECHIQEAAISICKGAKEGSVSIENHLNGELRHFRKGVVLSEVSVDTSCGIMNSLITTDAFERMELHDGCEVTLLLKAVDIKIVQHTQAS